MGLLGQMRRWDNVKFMMENVKCKIDLGKGGLL